MICFLVLRLRRMSFDMKFLLLRPKKISYMCIELSLSVIDLELQLKISHDLADIDVIDTS
jgi:hypothetical protein